MDLEPIVFTAQIIFRFLFACKKSKIKKVKVKKCLQLNFVLQRSEPRVILFVTIQKLTTSLFLRCKNKERINYLGFFLLTLFCQMLYSKTTENQMLKAGGLLSISLL